MASQEENNLSTLNQVPAQSNNTDEKLELILQKIEKYHEESKKESKKEHYGNLAGISLGFALSVAALAFSNTLNQFIIASVAVVLLVIALIAFYLSNQNNNHK